MIRDCFLRVIDIRWRKQIKIIGFFCAILVLFSLQNDSVDAQSRLAQEERMDQWLSIITLARPELRNPSLRTKEDLDLGERHFNYWKQKTADGVVVMVGRTLDEDEHGNLAPDAVGLIIFEAPDRKTAEALMSADPGVRGGLWRFRLSRYRVALSRSPSASKN